MWRIRSSALVAVAGFLLAACGAGVQAPSQSASADGATTSPTASVLIWSDAAHAPALQASASAHGETTGVEVLVETIGTDLGAMQDEISRLAPQGQGPDLFVGRSDWVGSLVEAGLIAPIDLGSASSKFRSVAVGGFTYAGRTYAVPFATENLALLRNTDLARRAPDSIEQMARVGLELAQERKRVLPIGLPVGRRGDAYHWYPLYSAAGGAIFGSDTQGGYSPVELEVGQPGSVEAARQLASLAEKGALDVGTTQASALRAFTSGRSPYLIAGPGVINTVRTSGVPFVVEGVPGFDAVLASRSKALVSSQGLLRSAFARNPGGAQQYLSTTATTTEVMSALASPGGLAPAWAPSYELAAADPVIAGFGEYADSSAVMPNLTEMADVWPALDEAEVAVMAGSNPAATMRAAGRSIQATIDEG